MADISTLVDDIQGLLDNGHLTQRAAPEIGQVITNRLKEHLEPRSEKTLRMSTIGKPDRQTWYDINYKGDDVEIPSSDAKMKWLFGDIIESMLVWLVEEAGHEVTDLQKEIVVEGIKGHIDLKCDGVLLDVKSASSASYKRFTKDNMITDPFLSNYVAQLAGYCESEKCDGAFLVLDKQLGKLKLISWSLEELKQVKIKQLIKHKKELVKQKEPPERCFLPIVEENGNEKLPIGCVYCKHRFHCYKDANDGQGLRIFRYSNGWQYLCHVEKLPRVEEINIKDIT